VDGHRDECSQAILEPQVGVGSGGHDGVMVPVDQGAALPLSTRVRDAAVPVAPETSTAGIASSIGGAEDMSMSRYLPIPGIAIIDPDATEVPSNDREMLKAVTERSCGVRCHALCRRGDLIWRSSCIGCHHVGATGAAPGRRCWWVHALCRAGGGKGVLGESANGAESTAIAPPL
jgi:hypothetical protein